MRAARLTSIATLAWLLAISLTVVPTAQAPANEEEFDKLMKAVGATVGSLGKNIKGSMASAVAADAKQLAELQKNNAAFWTARKAQDAADWANGVVTHAMDIEKAAAANDMAGAAEHMKLALANCQQCHGKYREKGPDGFMMKKQ